MDIRNNCEWAKISSDTAMNTPSVEHFLENRVQVASCWIPYDDRNAYKVYFVSDHDGNEFGQFSNLPEALTQARKMAKLTLEQRRQYDQ